MKLDWRLVAPGDGPAISTSLTLAETDELRRLASVFPGQVLEIGSAYGYSAVCMALAGGHVTAIDPHTWLDSHDAMVANLAAYGVTEQVEIYRGYSHDVLPVLASAGIRFDLVWIDGDHEAPTVTHDVQWALQLLKSTGTLACHDYDEVTCPGVRQALDAWKSPAKLVDTLAVYGPGEW